VQVRERRADALPAVRERDGRAERDRPRGRRVLVVLLGRRPAPPALEQRGVVRGRVERDRVARVVVVRAVLEVEVDARAPPVVRERERGRPALAQARRERGRGERDVLRAFVIVFGVLDVLEVGCRSASPVAF
jgi:hypothetical protein